MKEEKLIPAKKLYYILSSIGLFLSIVSISLLFSIDKLWLNIGLSIGCIVYAAIFVISASSAVIPEEPKQPGWLLPFLPRKYFHKDEVPKTMVW